MSREVEERVVEMQFDNRQFETGVAQTISSLDKLTDALKFEGVGNSVRSIQNGINSLNFDPITNGVSALEGTLTTLGGRIKMEVFDRLANYAVDTGEKIFKALTMQGAKAGFAEYETQQGAVQTILANTQHLGTTITDVNKALNDLNEYADLTIYNFTEMTRNIGTFTAAGLDLETSTSAIKGIANLAAVSGSTSEQASRAMYQLSQALAAGRVNLQDWNSVVNAGMGGKVFQDALKRTATHMGIVVDETKSFRESISAKDGSAWLTADVLSETLKQFSGDLDEAALAAQGWSEAEIKEITTMAKTATDAATVVKTFSQLMDTISEQIGSGWTKTWQLIFGDFEESKELWTSVYKAISPYIDAISDLRNGYLQFWKENEGREKVIQAFSNLWSGASNFIDKFVDAFKDAFPIFNNFGQVLVDASDRFLKFSERFKVVKEKADQLTTSFSKVSDAIGKITAEDKKNALDIWNWGNINGNPGRIDGQARVEALGESYDRVQKYINTFIATGYDVAKTDELLGVGAESVSEALDATSASAIQAVDSDTKLAIVLHNITSAFAGIVDVAKAIGGSVIRVVKAAASAFGDVFDAITVSSDIAGVAGVLAKVAHAFEITAEKAEDVKRIFRGVFAAFDIVYRLVRAVASAIGSALLPSLSGVDKAGGGLLKVLGNFGDWVYALDQAIREGDIFNVAIEKMIGFIGTLDDKIISVVHSFEEWSGIDFGKVASKIAGAVTKGLAVFKDWTGIDIAAIFKNIWEHIKTFIGLLKQGDFKGAFKYVVDGIKSFVTTVVDTVKNFSFGDLMSKAGGIFGGIVDWFKETFSSDKLAEAASGSGSILLKIFGGIALALKTAFGAIASIVTGPAAKELGSKLKELVKGLFTDTTEEAGESKSGMEKFKDFLVGVGSALAAFYEQVKPIVSAGFAGGFLKALIDIAAAFKNFSETPKNFTNALLELATGFDNMQKAFKIETMTRFVNALANALLKLVAAILIIIILDKLGVDVMGAVTTITIMLTELLGALTFAQKKLDSSLDMMMLVRMLKAIGNTMLKLAISLAIIGKIGDGEKIGSALVGFSVIMLELEIMLGVMAKIISSKQFRRGGEGLMMLVALMDQLGKTVMKMSVALAILSLIPAEQMGSAMFGLVGMLTMLALMLTVITKLTQSLGEGKKDELAAITGTLTAIAAAFLIMTPAVLSLAIIPEDRMQSALAAVVGIGALMAGMLAAIEAFSKGGTNSKAILAAGGAIVGIALAIQMLVPALGLLALMDPASLWGAVAAMEAILAGIMLVLVVLSKMGGGNVALAGVGLLALAFAFSVAVPPIILFGKFAVPLMEKAFAALKKQSGADIAKIIAAIAGFSLVLAIASVAVTAFGIALTVLAIPIAIITLSIAHMVKAFALLAPLVAIVAATGSEIGKVLAMTILKFLGTLIRGAKDIAEAIIDAAPMIAQAVLAILDAILMGTIGRIPVIVEAFLSTIDQVLTSLVDHMPTILYNLGLIVDMILDWLVLNIGGWTAKLVDIVVSILIGVIVGVANRLPEILQAVAYFLGMLIYGIFTLFAKLFDGLLGGGKKWTSWWEKHGGDFIYGFVENWKTGVDEIKKFFTEDLPAGIAGAWEDFKAVGSSVMEAIAQGMIDAMPWGHTMEGLGAWLAGDATAPEVEVVDYQDLLKKKNKEAADVKKAQGQVTKAYSQAGKDATNAYNKSMGVSSPSKEAYDTSSYFVEGGVDGLDANGFKFTDAMGDLGTDGVDAFSENLLAGMNNLDYDSMAGDITDKFNNMDLGTVSPTMEVSPDVHMDTDAIMANASPMNLLKDAISKDQNSTNLFGSFGNNFTMTTTMSQETAQMEQQRHADTEANTTRIKQLTDAMTRLTDNWKGGVINIPENATFTVPVTVDGETIAEVTAPYLDVINANNIDMTNKGVSTR